MQKSNFILLNLSQLFYLIHISHQVFNIDDFGAISDDPSYEAAIKNGKALNLALCAANQSNSDRSILIPNKWYGMLPAGGLDRLTNVTINFNGKLNSWDEDHSKYPRDRNGNALNFISLTNTENLIIRGNGVIEGNGYLWWLNVIQTGIDDRPNLIDLSTSKNLLIDGITLLNSPRYHLNARTTLNATIMNLVIRVNVTFNSSTAATFPLNTGYFF